MRLGISGCARVLRLGASAVAVTVAFAALPAGVSAGTSLFEPYQVRSVGSAPAAVAIGDVTGDGRNDVVLTTGYNADPANDYRLFVFAQAADGTLGAPVSYATAATYGARPNSVVVGDVTGDGRKDVVLGLSGLGIQVFRQTATGTLGGPYFIATADSDQVRLGRLNGDSLLDIAGVGWGTNSVTLFLSDGPGNFGPAVTYPVLHGGYDDLRVADVTGDGLDDLVVMSGQLYADPNVSVLAQLASGGFAAATPYTVGQNVLTSGIGVGDVTGDGRNDVVASYGGNRPTSSVGVFGQTATGTLATPVSYASYDCPEPVAVADVDGDGHADVVTVHGGWERVGVYRSQPGAGTLAAEELYPVPYASHYGPSGLAVGDFSGDGRADIAIADYNYGLVMLRQPAPPTAPLALTATAAKAAVTLRWTAPASQGGAPISAYRVYRGTSPGAETLLTTVAGSATSYLDKTVARKTKYYYRISAVNAAGEGPLSAEVSATPK